MNAALLLVRSTPFRSIAIRNFPLSVSIVVYVYDFARTLFDEELERCLLNSLVICLFARKLYNRETVLKALNSAGYTLTDDDLTTIAKRVYTTKLRIKEKLGFDPRQVILPKRFFETPSIHGTLDPSVAERMINRYVEKCSKLKQ